MKNTVKNIITMTFKYKASESGLSIISVYQRDYNSLLRSTYNCLLKNPKIKFKELTAHQKSLKNNKCTSYFRSSAVYDAKGLIERCHEKKIVFGGKKNLKLRVQNKISKVEQFFKLCMYSYISRTLRTSNS